MEWGQIFNRYSFVIAAGGGLILAWVVGRRFGRWARRGVLAVLVLAAVGAVAVLRTGAGDIATVAQFDEVLAGFRPVVFEVYSDW